MKRERIENKVKIHNLPELWKKLNIMRAEAQTNECAQQLPSLSMTAVVCHLYQNALLTLNSLHTDILSGIFRHILSTIHF